eukprot:scaffold62527_cov49-Attheya_sp.AAC.3
MDPPATLRCDPKLLGKDLTSQIIIVTGANQGCGLETARQLSKQGATVVLACRNKERGEEAAKQVAGGVFLQLDLASLESVREFAKAFEAKFDRLDALINNAGIICGPYSKTKDGHEVQFACNHLGGFLLMHFVHPGWVVKESNPSGMKIPTVDGAQSTLHCVLEDAEKLESGAFYSQMGIYMDEDSVKGGWPMKLPNPNATPEAAAKLWKVSEALVGL